MVSIFIYIDINRNTLLVEGRTEVRFESGHFAWYCDDDNSDTTEEQHLPNGATRELNSQIVHNGDPGYSTGTLKLANINLEIKQVTIS